MDEHKKYLSTLLLCFVILVVLYFANSAYQSYALPPTQSRDPNAFLPPPDAPPRTEENSVSSESKKPFDVLVSYANDGFAPTQLTLVPGKTVRFMNNADTEMELLLTTQPVLLKKGEYWQFTFSKKGLWILAVKGTENEMRITVK